MEESNKEGINKRKTTLSALYILTGLASYKTEMLNVLKEHKVETDKQEKTEKQLKNWVTTDDVEILLKKWKK
jgi:hypothetical protein